jgi:transcriptional regulator with XRE-family HTH domain
VMTLIEEMAERGLKKSDLARLLGVNRSVVSRMLNGTAPLELRTIGQLAWAMGRDPQFRLVKKKRRARGSNLLSPANAPQPNFGPTFTTMETP